MAYTVMAYVVMALHSYGLNSYGLYSYGLYNYGRYSYGLYLALLCLLQQLQPLRLVRCSLLEIFIAAGSDIGNALTVARRHPSANVWFGDAAPVGTAPTEMHRRLYSYGLNSYGLYSFG